MLVHAFCTTLILMFVHYSTNTVVNSLTQGSLEHLRRRIVRVEKVGKDKYDLRHRMFVALSHLYACVPYAQWAWTRKSQQ